MGTLSSKSGIKSYKRYFGLHWDHLNIDHILNDY